MAQACDNGCNPLYATLVYRLIRSFCEDQWIATGISQCPRDDKGGGVKARDDNALSVIARRERSEGRGNPSCLEGRLQGMRFGSWLTVDRHGLRPRDDN